MELRHALSALAILWATACGEGEAGSELGAGGQMGSHGGASTGTPLEGDTVTFYEHVAPILYANCVGCHRPGDVAPFSLVDYASARALAPSIARAVRAREMPPMPVDNSGECNTYANARWLSDTQIATLEAWAAQGALEGDPKNAVAVPEPPAGLGTPDLTLDPGVEYEPSTALPDDYRCFVLASPVTRTRYVTHYEVVPGDPRLVHHVIVYQPSSPGEVDRARALDAAEDGPGYTCFGGSGVDAEPVVLWAPGGGAVELPKDTGIALQAGRDLILQVHYNLSAGSFPDRSTVRLKLAPGKVNPAQYMAIADLDMSLTPRLASAETFAEFDVGLRSSLIFHGALPHMHTLGKTLRVEATSGGQSRCMVSVDRWDFHWQNAWWYEAPIRLDGLDTASIRCGFDTSGRTRAVTWGEGTEDEMCLTYFYVSTP